MGATTKLNLIQEKSDGQSVSYLLDDAVRVSETGMKVLKSQEKVGFLHSYFIHFNGKAKLVYLLNEYTSLYALLDTARPDVFLTYLINLFQIIDESKNIGFMQYSNIQTRLERIYVDQNTGKIWLVYLPLEQEGISMDFSTFTSALFSNIAAAVMERLNLQSNDIQQIVALMQSTSGNFAVVKDALSRAAAATATGSLQTAATSNNLTVDFSGQGAGNFAGNGAGNFVAAPSEPQQQNEVVMQQVQVVDAPEKKGLFSKLFSKEPKKEEKNSYVMQEEGGATEVLGEIFVPTIVLTGVRTPEKISILVSKGEFIIGKKEELCDFAILFNPAISRQHAKIISSNGRVYIEDLGSANGTFLNEARLAPNSREALNVGDKLKFANSNFLVKSV